MLCNFNKLEESAVLGVEQVGVGRWVLKQGSVGETARQVGGAKDKSWEGRPGNSHCFSLRYLG